jgi:hypothetical protein
MSSAAESPERPPPMIMTRLDIVVKKNYSLDIHNYFG